MIDLRYSLMIEATEEPDFFSFYSTELEGFTGVGHSVEDCPSARGKNDHLMLAKIGHPGELSDRERGFQLEYDFTASARRPGEE